MTPGERPDEIDRIYQVKGIDLDAFETRPDPGNALWKRLAVTILGLALYAALARVPLPGLIPAEPGIPPLRQTGILALGITPLVTSFLLVELFAVFIPAGQRLRERGLAGRARLNRISLFLGLGVCLVQGYGISLFLSTITTPYGFSYVADPGPRFALLTVLTLTAATAGLWAFAELLSRAGLGNGFCLILLFNLLEPVVRSSLARELPAEALAAPLSVAVLLALYIALVERGEREREETALPAFPQGVVPVAFLLPFLGLVSRAIPQLTSWTAALLLAALAFPLSWVIHLAVSSPNCLANELPGAAAEAARFAAVLRRRLPVATLILAFSAAGLAAWTIWRPEMPAPLTFIGIAAVVASLFDLVEEVRFTARHGRTERVLSFDNVYLAQHLTEVLKDAGIDALPRARRYRSLLFFFGALVKIELLVPADRLTEAQELVAREKLAIL
jgi:SecY